MSSFLFFFVEVETHEKHDVTQGYRTSLHPSYYIIVVTASGLDKYVRHVITERFIQMNPMTHKKT